MAIQNVKSNDQQGITRAISLRMNKVVQSDLKLSTNTTYDSRTIDMASGHGLVANDHIIILEENGFPQFFFAKILSVSTNELTLDTLVSHEFTADGATVTQYDPELNKGGSATVYKAELRNPFSHDIDVIRLIMHITDGSAMDDALFGGRAALTRGVAFRKNIGTTDSDYYWNVKSNGAIGELTFDKMYDEKAPSGVYGFSARLTYAGETKHGVPIRLKTGQAIELLIQDDLTGLLSFFITAEGHFVEG